MRKIYLIATISLLILASSCGGSGTKPPTVLTVEPKPDMDLSFEDPSGEDKMVFTYHLGPYNLSKETATVDMIEKPASVRFNVDEPIWVRSFKPTIEDNEGNLLPSELVHSIILINHAEENPLCTGEEVGNPFAAATSTMEEIVLPKKHGYLALPEDMLEARVILKNTTDIEYRNVYIKFTLSGKRVNGTNNITDVRPMMIDINPCTHEPISISPGQFVEKKIDAYAPSKSKLVKAYGLLQDYAVSVSLSKGDESKYIWEGLAEIDENYNILSLPEFEDSVGISLERGEKLTLTISYDNAEDRWLEEATAAALIYVTRSEDESRINEKEAISVISAQRRLLLD